MTRMTGPRRSTALSCAALSSVCLTLLPAAPAAAQPTIVYSNITNPQIPDGATQPWLGGAQGNEIQWDDLTLEGGGVLEEVVCTFANLTGTPYEGAIEVHLNEDDMGSVGPSLGVLTFNTPEPFLSGESYLLFFNALSDKGILLPEDGTIWAGTRIVNADPLDVIGQSLYNPPTVGSSMDYFQREDGNLYFFGGDPVANFGWELRVTADGPTACNGADVSPPFGVLDLNDINDWVAAFIAQDLLADLSGDGILDLTDVQAFQQFFIAGCP